MESVVISSFNLLLLIGLLFFKVRRPAQGMVAQRHETIRTEIETVRKSLSSAQEKYNEFSAKLKAIDAELQSLREQTRQESQQIRQTILSEANRMAGTIVSDARTSAQSLYSDLRGQLRQELGCRVLDRAEQLLRERLTGDDRVRIREEFSKQVERIR